MIKAHTIVLALSLALLGSALPQLSHAAQEGGGSHAGNGGDVVYCEHPLPGQKRIELLDLYESRVLRENTLALGEDGWDYQRRVTFVLDRLKRLDASRAQDYADISSYLLRNSEFTNDELPDIPDSMHVALPKGCVIRQIAVQGSWAVNHLLVIDKPLWDMLDEENRAALVLHETIYYEALSLNQSNSINTRFFNGALTSKALETMDLKTYLDLLEKVEFRFKRVILDDGNWFNLPEKTLDSETFCQSVSAHFFGHDLYGCLDYEIADNKFHLKRFIAKDIYHHIGSILENKTFFWSIDGKASGQILEFWSVTVDHNLRVLRGEVNQGVRRKGAHYDLQCGRYSIFSYNDAPGDDECAIFDRGTENVAEVQGRQVQIIAPGEYGTTVSIDSKLDRVTYARFFQPEQFSIRSKTLTFWGAYKTSKNGNIVTGFLKEPGELQIPNSSRYIDAAKDSQIFLYEDGTVYQAMLANGAFLKKKDSGRTYISSGATVRFNEQGEVVN